MAKAMLVSSLNEKTRRALNEGAQRFLLPSQIGLTREEQWGAVSYQ